MLKKRGQGSGQFAVGVGAVFHARAQGQDVGLAAVLGGALKVPNLVPLPVLWNLLKVQNFGESPRVTWLTEILVKANARGQVLVWNHRHPTLVCCLHGHLGQI